jgi:hypothetical protein
METKRIELIPSSPIACRQTRNWNYTGLDSFGVVGSLVGLKNPADLNSTDLAAVQKFKEQVDAIRNNGAKQSRQHALLPCTGLAGLQRDPGKGGGKERQHPRAQLLLLLLLLLLHGGAYWMVIANTLCTAPFRCPWLACLPEWKPAAAGAVCCSLSQHNGPAPAGLLGR